jgi:hypothetical protein
MKIIVRISPKAEVKVEVDGMQGASCKDVTKQLEKALGNTVKSEEKGEFYEQEQTNTNELGLGNG